MVYSPKIGGRLGLGFSIGVLFTLIVGLVSVASNNTLSNVAEDLYRHPFTVANALKDAKGNLFDVRNMVKDLVNSTDPMDVEPIIARIHAIESDTARQFAVIRARYLGPPLDVDRMVADYEALRAHRETVLALTLKGSRTDAKALSAAEGAALFKAVRTDMDVILAFAERRAIHFIEEARATRDEIRTLILIIVCGAIGASMIAALLTVRSIARPLTMLNGAMAELSRGNLTVTVAGVERHDEIGEMAKAVQVFKDGLIHAQALEQALRQAHKMEALGQMTGGIAHDFNNLLQVILANLDLCLRGVNSEAAPARYLHNAMAGAEQGAKLTSQLLAFARKQPLSPKSLRIDRQVGAMTQMLRRTIGERIDIETINSGGLWTALVDPNQLQNAILNLAINARDAMPDGGKLTIEMANASLDAGYAAAHSEVKAGQYVMLAMTDTGTGMSPDIVAKVFEPFFTTKAEGTGTGLGLSMVFGFVKQSGGHIKIYSELGLGTTVKLYLPRTHQAETARLAEEVKATRGNGETILVAEDDDGVRASVVTQLAELGYRVLAAADGEAALDLLARGERIDLLFTDVVMPGAVSGRSLADRARGLIPDLRVVFTSGYTENAIIHNGRLDEGVTLLSKPYRLSQLAGTIHAALGRPAEPFVPHVPAAPPAASPAPPPGPVPPADGSRILVVEDDMMVRTATVEILEHMGYRVQATGCPEDALRRIAAERNVQILITDLNLPVMDGLNLARAARACHPTLSVIVATGQHFDPGDLPDPSISLLLKPFCIQTLMDTIEAALIAQAESTVAETA
jgi:signal transduction histidine kinase/DNA-binding response OmpR family regulator